MTFRGSAHRSSLPIAGQRSVKLASLQVGSRWSGRIKRVFLALQDIEENDLIAAIDNNISRVQAVVLSDYGKSVFSLRLLKHVIGAAFERTIPVFCRSEV